MIGRRGGGIGHWASQGIGKVAPPGAAAWRRVCPQQVDVPNRHRVHGVTALREWAVDQGAVALDLSALPDEVRALIAMQAATIARLQAQLAKLRRMHFGRSSERDERMTRSLSRPSPS
jgi:hypothetical protein